jgi:hypothetical protein
VNLADKPLEPDSPFYEPVYQKLGLDDPVQQLSTLIDFSEQESLHLISGFRGCDKTTELFRLRRLLENRAYFVLYSDALNYVNVTEPIEISALLLVLAGAFSDAAEESLGRNIARETFWERLLRFLKSDINLKETILKLDYETPFKRILGGLKAGIDLKFNIKTPTKFRTGIREQRQGDADVQEGPVHRVDRCDRRRNRSALHQPPVRPLCVSRRHDQAFMRRDRIFATWGNCGRLLSDGVKSDRIGLGIGKKESSHGAVCWPGRITEGDEPLRGGSNGHDLVARQVCVDT